MGKGISNYCKTTQLNGVSMESTDKVDNLKFWLIAFDRSRGVDLVCNTEDGKLKMRWTADLKTPVRTRS